MKMDKTKESFSVYDKRVNTPREADAHNESRRVLDYTNEADAHNELVRVQAADAHNELVRLQAVKTELLKQQRIYKVSELARLREAEM